MSSVKILSGNWKGYNAYIKRIDKSKIKLVLQINNLQLPNESVRFVNVDNVSKISFPYNTLKGFESDSKYLDYTQKDGYITLSSFEANINIETTKVEKARVGESTTLYISPYIFFPQDVSLVESNVKNSIVQIISGSLKDIFGKLQSYNDNYLTVNISTPYILGNNTMIQNYGINVIIMQIFPLLELEIEANSKKYIAYQNEVKTSDVYLHDTAIPIEDIFINEIEPEYKEVEDPENNPEEFKNEEELDQELDQEVEVEVDQALTDTIARLQNIDEDNFIEEEDVSKSRSYKEKDSYTVSRHTGQYQRDILKSITQLSAQFKVDVSENSFKILSIVESKKGQNVNNDNLIYAGLAHYYPAIKKSLTNRKKKFINLNKDLYTTYSNELVLEYQLANMSLKNNTQAPEIFSIKDFPKIKRNYYLDKEWKYVSKSKIESDNMYIDSIPKESYPWSSMTNDKIGTFHKYESIASGITSKIKNIPTEVVYSYNYTYLKSLDSDSIFPSNILEYIDSELINSSMYGINSTDIINSLISQGLSESTIQTYFTSFIEEHIASKIISKDVISYLDFVSKNIVSSMGSNVTVSQLAQIYSSSYKSISVPDAKAILHNCGIFTVQKNSIKDYKFKDPFDATDNMLINKLKNVGEIKHFTELEYSIFEKFVNTNLVSQSNGTCSLSLLYRRYIKYTKTFKLKIDLENITNLIIDSQMNNESASIVDLQVKQDTIIESIKYLEKKPTENKYPELNINNFGNVERFTELVSSYNIKLDGDIIKDHTFLVPEFDPYNIYGDYKISRSLVRESLDKIYEQFKVEDAFKTNIGDVVPSIDDIYSIAHFITTGNKKDIDTILNFSYGDIVEALSLEYRPESYPNFESFIEEIINEAKNIKKYKDLQDFLLIKEKENPIVNPDFFDRISVLILGLKTESGRVKRKLESLDKKQEYTFYIKPIFKNTPKAIKIKYVNMIRESLLDLEARGIIVITNPQDEIDEIDETPGIKKVVKDIFKLKKTNVVSKKVDPISFSPAKQKYKFSTISGTGKLLQNSILEKLNDDLFLPMIINTKSFKYDFSYSVSIYDFYKDKVVNKTSDRGNMLFFIDIVIKQFLLHIGEKIPKINSYDITSRYAIYYELFKDCENFKFNNFFKSVCDIHYGVSYTNCKYILIEMFKKEDSVLDYKYWSSYLKDKLETLDLPTWEFGNQKKVISEQYEIMIMFMSKIVSIVTPQMIFDLMPIEEKITNFLTRNINNTVSADIVNDTLEYFLEYAKLQSPKLNITKDKIVHILNLIGNLETSMNIDEVKEFESKEIVEEYTINNKVYKNIIYKIFYNSGSLVEGYEDLYPEIVFWIGTDVSKLNEIFPTLRNSYKIMKELYLLRQNDSDKNLMNVINFMSSCYPLLNSNVTNSVSQTISYRRKRPYEE